MEFGDEGVHATTQRGPSWELRVYLGDELARRTGMAQQTVAGELARLEAAGVIEPEQVGTAKIPRPAADLPYLGPLRQLLAYAGGVIPALHACTFR